MIDCRKTIFRYHELIGKPLQTLMKRIEETSILTNDESKVMCNNTDCNKLTKPPECSSNNERSSFENGNGIADHSDENVSEMTIANGCSVTDNERLNDDIPLDQSNITPNYEQNCVEDEIHSHEMRTDLIRSTIDAMALNSNDRTTQQQDSVTIEQPNRNFVAENTCLSHYTTIDTDVYSDILRDSNYKCLLVMEAIKQFEKHYQIDQQQVNVQSGEITTSDDLQVNTSDVPTPNRSCRKETSIQSSHENKEDQNELAGTKYDVLQIQKKIKEKVPKKT